MDKTQFTQVIPRIRVYETKLLDKTKIDRMVDAKDATDALKVLQETEYSILMNNIKRPEDYEILLTEELKRVYNLLYSICPNKKIIDIMALRYDYHNIKVLIKGKILKKDFSHMLINVGTVKLEKIKDAIENDNYRELDRFKRKATEEVEQDFSNHKDPQRIDIILDKYLFEEMKFLASDMGDLFLNKYMKSTIDFTNIKSLLRVKKQNREREFLNYVFISGGSIGKEKLLALINDSVENIAGKLAHTDYGKVIKQGIEAYTKTGSIGILEKLADNYIMDMMKNGKLVFLGIEPIIAYIFAKENEIKLIRIIMVGKLNNISGEVIRERLRDAYV